ncbi:vesicle-associated membrane protein 5 [Thalassophryne amazonica]|uniref:vesicle-associated membrane protein 5 n=1 Tax=Thalassophryne amazonica TaxID=390379 RepID=UPI0014724AD7|nr:vesicle-associated membrane protein 5 [Thalassophryne amazonica]
MENGKSRLQQAQQDVEEVKVIMLDNINKADERSGKLGELENRADELLQKSKTFERTAVKVKQKKRWENKKVKIVLIIAGASLAIVLVALIIYGIVSSVQGQ